jgi:hypothetical protein
LKKAFTYTGNEIGYSGQFFEDLFPDELRELGAALVNQSKGESGMLV